jgi:ElaB/YqjD/DUF883 family membrane-anchored ribosome-binding protein
LFDFHARIDFAQRRGCPATSDSITRNVAGKGDRFASGKLAASFHMNPNPHPEDSTDPNASFSKTAADLASKAKEGLRSAGETLREKGQAAVSAAGEAASKAGERLRDTASSVAERATDVAHDLGERASDLYRRASSRVRTLGEDSVEFVRENPVSTVLTALAAGVVLGYALRR